MNQSCISLPLPYCQPLQNIYYGYGNGQNPTTVQTSRAYPQGGFLSRRSIVARLTLVAWFLWCDSRISYLSGHGDRGQVDGVFPEFVQVVEVTLRGARVGVPCKLHGLGQLDPAYRHL